MGCSCVCFPGIQPRRSLLREGWVILGLPWCSVCFEPAVTDCNRGLYQKNVKALKLESYHRVLENKA